MSSNRTSERMRLSEDCLNILQREGFRSIRSNQYGRVQNGVFCFLRATFRPEDSIVSYCAWPFTYPYISLGFVPTGLGERVPAKSEPISRDVFTASEVGAALSSLIIGEVVPIFRELKTLEGCLSRAVLNPKCPDSTWPAYCFIGMEKYAEAKNYFSRVSAYFEATGVPDWSYEWNDIRLFLELLSSPVIDRKKLQELLRENCNENVKRLKLNNLFQDISVS